jgi:predicted transcriptional regulator
MSLVKIINANENNKTRMEKTEQLKSILTDLDNRELTKHQAHDLICVLFSVVVPKGTLCDKNENKLGMCNCCGDNNCHDAFCKG